jgi:hypothetical protein
MEFDFRRTQKQIVSSTEPIIPVEEVGHLSSSYATLNNTRYLKESNISSALLAIRVALLCKCLLQNSLLYWDVTTLCSVCWQIFNDYSGQPIGTEKSVTRCQLTQHDIADKRRPQRHRSGNLKYHNDGICERTSV